MEAYIIPKNSLFFRVSMISSMILVYHFFIQKDIHLLFVLGTENLRKKWLLIHQTFLSEPLQTEKLAI